MDVQALMKSFEKGCFLTTQTRSFPRSFQTVSAATFGPKNKTVACRSRLKYL
jgi:hypothetical protein